MAPFDFGFQPKDRIPNIVFSPEGGTLSEDDQKKLEGADSWMTSSKREILCRACGWNTYHELCSSYLPRLRMFHVRSNAGLWMMGNDYLIWDRVGNLGTGTNDYMTWKFLRDQQTKNIPLVEEMYQFGKEGDQFQFTVMSRAKGVPLENIWAKLTPEEKRSYADQMIAALCELRQFTAPSPQRVDGSPLGDNIVGKCWPNKMCKIVPATKEEWLSDLDEELRIGVERQLRVTDNPNKPTPEALLHEIQTTFPDPAPFVLTHTDLHMGNIMVHDGKILAIIDWETSGFHPWWVERWASYERAISGNSDELFDMVWAEVDPELSHSEFCDKAAVPVNVTAKAYASAPIEHTQSHDVWLRPKWCECKPYGGMCSGKDWGAELEHEINYKAELWVSSKTKRFMREAAPKEAKKEEDEEVTGEGDESLDKQLERVQL